VRDEHEHEDADPTDDDGDALVERLFAADLAYLQDLYNEINRVDDPNRSVMCPNCRQAFELEVQTARARGPEPRPADMAPGTAPRPPRPGREPKPPKEPARQRKRSH